MILKDNDVPDVITLIQAAGVVCYDQWFYAKYDHNSGRCYYLEITNTYYTQWWAYDTTVTPKLPNDTFKRWFKGTWDLKVILKTKQNNSGLFDEQRKAWYTTLETAPPKLMGVFIFVISFKLYEPYFRPFRKMKAHKLFLCNEDCFLSLILFSIFDYQ